MPRSPGLRRLTSADLSNLRYETPAMPMHIGALFTVEAAPLLDGTGAVRTAEIQRRIDLRLSRVPVLRQRLHRPGLLQGRPLWVDDRSFDIRRHVRLLDLVGPADDPELLVAVEQLMGKLLWRSRPLWQLWVISGLSDARLAILLKIHHAIADGLAVVAILSALFDFDATAIDPPADLWRPAAPPRARELLADNLASGCKTAGRAALAIAQLPRTGGGMSSTITELMHRLARPYAPQTSINRPVLPGRHVRYTRVDLDDVRARAHQAGAKVNDVVLDLVAGGLRHLLQSRGELVAGLQLIASVPVSLRSGAEAATLGNAVGVMTVPLDVGEPDACRRLASIVTVTNRAKREQRPAHVEALMAWLAATPIAHAFISHQRLVNVFVTNVPGPAVPAYFLGAHVIDTVPIVSPSGNVAVAFCAFSYAGHLYLVATVDATACPDVDRLIEGAEAAWHELRGG
jgi:diacylglycerol O-acyltransferase